MPKIRVIETHAGNARRDATRLLREALPALFAEGPAAPRPKQWSWDELPAIQGPRPQEKKDRARNNRRKKQARRQRKGF